MAASCFHQPSTSHTLSLFGAWVTVWHGSWQRWLSQESKRPQGRPQQNSPSLKQGIDIV